MRSGVAVDAAAHIYDRLTAALDDPADLRDRLVDARRRLRGAFEAEREPLSSVDRQEPWQVEGVDVEDTPAAEALEELFRPIDPERDDGWDGTTPAEALTWTHASFVTLAALVALRERVREDETFVVESVTDVDAVRSAAIEALLAAEASPAEPALTRHSTAELAAQLAWVDEELLNEEGSVRTSWLRNDVGTYLTVMARARATPAASERVAEALRARPRSGAVSEANRGAVADMGSEASVALLRHEASVALLHLPHRAPPVAPFGRSPLRHEASVALLHLLHRAPRVAPFGRSPLRHEASVALLPRPRTRKAVAPWASNVNQCVSPSPTRAACTTRR